MTPDTDRPKLTPKQELFCQEYIVDLNATQAAIRSGYKAKTARVIGHENLTKPDIVKRVEELQKELSDRLKITPAMVLKRLWDIATADVNGIVQYRRVNCRHCWGEDFQWQRTDLEYANDRERYEERKSKLDESERQVMPEFDHRGGIGFDPTKNPNTECPECYGEGKGEVFFQDTRMLPPELRALFAGVRVTRDGTTLLLHSQDKALELVAKHLGMFTDKVEITGEGGGPVQFEQFLAKIYGDKKPEG